LACFFAESKAHDINTSEEITRPISDGRSLYDYTQ
jgi:hypothetical protein